jgi:hypothetical protein
VLTLGLLVAMTALFLTRRSKSAADSVDGR